jgi:uncharacterized protein YndB with AHSA1/START domain
MTSERVPNAIEKSILLRAPRERVWRAISTASEFGAWFGVHFDEPFVAGKTITGAIVPTTVDPEVAKLQEPHRGTPFTVVVETIDPPREFAFRWHPFAIDKGTDYSKEPTTLVSFKLSDAPDGNGTVLTIVESGFDGIPLERRAQAFRANEGGWSHQCKLVEKYLAQRAS